MYAYVGYSGKGKTLEDVFPNPKRVMALLVKITRQDIEKAIALQHIESFDPESLDCLLRILWAAGYQLPERGLLFRNAAVRNCHDLTLYDINVAEPNDGLDEFWGLYVLRKMEALP